VIPGAPKAVPAGPPEPPPSGRDPCPPGPVARLLARAAEAPNRPALRQIGGPIHGESGERSPDGMETVLTRDGLVREVARTAAALRALGVEEEDRVALMLPNSRELVALHLALWSLGATAVVLSPLSTPAEAQRCLEDSLPAGLIAHSRAFSELAASGADLPRLRFAARADVAGRAGAPPWLYQGTVAVTGEPELREPPPGLLATVHFTYKGLGYPLGAKHTYEHYARAALAMGRFYRPGPDHTFLCALPLSHIYALTACVLTPLCTGGASAIVKSAAPQLVLRFAKTHGANVICLVPALYRLLGMCARRAGPVDLSRAFWISGGAYLSPELSQELEAEHGVHAHQGYGLTEALIVTASNPENDRRGALGVPLFADTEIAVLDERGEELPRGAVGELAVRAPTTMTGYIGRAAETARFLRDGRLLTGDIGRVDEEGFLRFEGRTRRFAKVAGYMVDLGEVEAAVASHPAVASCAAAADPDDISDESIRCAVTLRPGERASANEIAAHVKARLAFYKVPRVIRFVRASRPSASRG
jgi:long-chain acyl-CoA synthetase